MNEQEIKEFLCIFMMDPVKREDLRLKLTSTASDIARLLHDNGVEVSMGCSAMLYLMIGQFSRGKIEADMLLKMLQRTIDMIKNIKKSE